MGRTSTSNYKSLCSSEDVELSVSIFAYTILRSHLLVTYPGIHNGRFPPESKTCPNQFHYIKPSAFLQPRSKRCSLLWPDSISIHKCLVDAWFITKPLDGMRSSNYASLCLIGLTNQVQWHQVCDIVHFLTAYRANTLIQPQTDFGLAAIVHTSRTDTAPASQ